MSRSSKESEPDTQIDPSLTIRMSRREFLNWALAATGGFFAGVWVGSHLRESQNSPPPTFEADIQNIQENPGLNMYDKQYRDLFSVLKVYNALEKPYQLERFWDSGHNIYNYHQDHDLFEPNQEVTERVINGIEDKFFSSRGNEKVYSNSYTERVVDLAAENGRHSIAIAAYIYTGKSEDASVLDPYEYETVRMRVRDNDKGTVTTLQFFKVGYKLSYFYQEVRISDLQRSDKAYLSEEDPIPTRAFSWEFDKLLKILNSSSVLD